MLRGYFAMKRIQRQRTKGWRMPEGAVYVGRPSRWGNELRADMLDLFDRPLGLQRVVDLYRIATLRQIEDSDDGAEWAAEWLAPLRDKDLVCWCPLDQPCHADVLLELAEPTGSRDSHSGSAKPGSTNPQSTSVGGPR